MPNINGEELLYQVRNDAKLAATPLL